MAKTNEDRLWRRITVPETDTETSCWPWSGPTNASGHGLAFNGEKMVSAHRYVWTIVNGEIPGKQCVLQKCNNAACCNPNHLFIGSRTDKMQDRLKHGEHKTPWSKLDADDVRHIHSLVGVSNEEIAERFQISEYHVRRIRSGKSWRWIYNQAAKN